MLIIIFVFIFQTQTCNMLHNRSIIRGNYQNVLQFNEGALVSSRKLNGFAGGFDNGVMFRDSIYYITGSTGFTHCPIGKSIEISLLQPFELNTFEIWLWDDSNRTYNIIVYAKYDDAEKIIFDTLASPSIVKIHFDDELVSSFRIYNRGGNTQNTALHIIKAQAYYQT